MCAVEGIFSLRIVTVDFYMENPKPGLDPCFSEFRAKEIKKVPIIRIFGSNAEGQKTCMHVHGVFPYLYIPFDKKDFETVDKAVYLIASSIDKGINISLGQGSSGSQHVFKIQLVKGIPFYGYHQKEHQYFKVYMLNPRFIRRTANLLQNGAIMGKVFQPHESHVPYILQFFIDYNLYGMSFLHVPKEVLKFRRKTEEDVIPYPMQKGQVLNCNIAEKQSTSELELDIGSGFILNRFQLITKTSGRANPGIESIWQDERARRQKLSAECEKVPPLEVPASQERPDVRPTESDNFYRTGLVNKLQQLETSMDQTMNATLQSTIVPPERSIKEKKRTFNLKKLIANAVYPEECTQNDNLINASFIADHLSGRSIFHTPIKFSETPSVPESDDVFMDDTIVDEELVLSLTQSDVISQSLHEQDMELLDVMQQLDREGENGIDLDSTLAPLSQKLDLNSSQKAFGGNVMSAETLDIDSQEDDSDNECLNDFTMAMDDMDELLLKLSQPSHPVENIPTVAQYDGADDILRTPKKNKQQKLPTTPKTPSTPKITSKVGGGSPRTPKSVTRKYAPLPLIIQSRSLKKNLSEMETEASHFDNNEVISVSSEKSKPSENYTQNERKLSSLRKKLALNELRRKSISTDHELNGGNTPVLNRKVKKTMDLDKTHITCNLRSSRIKNERRLKVYQTNGASEAEQPKLPKSLIREEYSKCSILPEKALTKQNTVRSSFMEEPSKGAEISPRVRLKKCKRIKDLSLVDDNTSNGKGPSSSASKKKCRLSLKSHKKIMKRKENQNITVSSSDNVAEVLVLSSSPRLSNASDKDLGRHRTTPMESKTEKKKKPISKEIRKLRVRLKRVESREIKKLTSPKATPISPTTPIASKKPYSFIVNNKYEITPIAGPSHLNRFKIANLSTPRTPKRTISDYESDIEDDPTVHSFYEKSFIIDSPVFSEISVPSPGQLVKCKQPSHSPNADKVVLITPHLLPETYEEVERNYKIYDIPDMVHQQPFYSNYADVTHKKEVGHTVLCIPGKSLNDVEEFQSSVSNLEGLSDRRKKLMQVLGDPFRNDDRIREYLATEKIVLITPCKLPPTKQDAKVWLKARYLLKEKSLDVGEKHENFEEDSPIKIRRQKVVMLMENESGEGGEDMDCSMRSISLTPLTPVAAKKTETPKTGKSYDYTPLTAPKSVTKSLRRRRSLKAKVSLSQKLKDICLSNALEKCSEEDVPSTINCTQTIVGSEDELRTSRESSQSNETITNEAVLAELEKSSFVKNLHGSQGSFDTSFGLSIATLNNTFGFKVNLENLHQAKSDIEHNYLTTLSLEVFVSTREDLLPNPQFDAIMCIFYAIENSIPSTCTDGVSKTCGFIIVSDGDNATNAKFNGIDSDVEIKVANSELEGLMKLLELCSHWDPDIFVGYEIEMSSWGYILERAKYLDFNIAPLLSRVPSQKVRDFVDEDREQLTDLEVETKLCGRILLDVWRLMRSEIALTSYTFENVMYHILHRRCPLHTHKDLSQWFQAPQTKWIVLEYYLERVRGTLELLDQLDLIGRTSEMAKLIGIQFYEVLSRGSQFRVESMMLRIAKPKNLVPLSPSVQQRAHMRAPEYLPLILEPQSRFYPDPVIVLDFQSLYPSMIMAYNYCFSTCLGRVEHLGQSVPFEFGASQLRVSPNLLRKLLENELVTISPCGVVYVKREIREGILPRMLSEVLDTRQMVKQSMKLHKSSTALQRILHSRQLGLKLIANVTYGYTAANFSGRMPCVEVGDSVVAKGRETLERAIKLVEAHDEWNVRVVYGDTDSLFVLVPGRSRAEAFRIGAEIADLVTQDNPQPVKLKLEKVYQPCILQTKKRYVGYMFESPDQEEPIFEAKGIETVRRDGCPAASKMLEKCLKILFDSADVSRVKSYVCRQFTKLLSGKANIQDLIFAKEFRGLNGYRPTACVPALELTRKWIQTDPRKIPRRGERVPFIVTNGPPGLPLIRLVRSPHDVLADEGLKINAIYYITKAIIPPLNRCFLLIGADINEWFTNLPRKILLTPALSVGNEIIATNATKKSTISQYFSSTNCIIDCGRQTKQGICTFCSVDGTKSIVTLEEKIAKLQREYHLTQMICQACCGRPNFINCASLDCPVLYVLEVKRRELTQISHIRSIIDERDDHYWRNVVYENIQDLKGLTHASGLNLYWIDIKLNLITEKQTNIRTFESCMLSTDDQRFLVTLAANRKQIVYVKCMDSLFETNPEITLSFTANSIICVPIFTYERQVLLVLELYKTDGEVFSQEALGYILEFSKWFTIWLSQSFKHKEEEKIVNIYKNLLLFLLEYINGTSSYEQFLLRFMKHSKEYIRTDKYFFYDYDINTGFSDFYEEIGEKLLKTATRLRFHKTHSICYQVHERKEPLSVKVEDGCQQLDKEIKQDPQNPLRYMLFYPLLFGNRFLGIAVFGKTDEEFTKDEKLYVSKITPLLADGLLYRYILQQKEKQTSQTAIFRDTFMNLLKARVRPQFAISPNISVPQELHRFSWELLNVNDPNQLTYLCKMFQSTYRFNWDRLKSFLLCAQIAHNGYPYHNVKTTFHICRTVYCLLGKLGTKLKPHENAALMIAAVIYYCGHNGLDNHVMLKTKHPLTNIYKTYMKENHRVWMLKLILDQTKFLFDNKESELIISTVNNLLLKSKKYESKDFRQKILNMLDAKSFNLANATHRLYALLVILRIGIHGRHMQPFNLAKKLRDNYYQEMFRLGDFEKEKGYDFVERKNRQMHFKISQFEITYITDSVLPTLDILTRIFPETNLSMTMLKDILKAHEILVDAGNKKMWDPEACVGRTN